MKWSTITLPAMLFGVALCSGCGSAHTRATSSDGDAQVSFPDPARAVMSEGAFVNLANLRNVAPGMTKAQLYRLLGAPHFNEGVFGVRKWNYIFDFRKAGSTDYYSCQYQVQFDRHHVAEAFYWKPASCAAVLDRPPPMVAAPPPPAPLPKEPIRLSSDTLFAFDRADLTLSGRSALAGILHQVRQASEVQNITVTGYTDRIGSTKYNLALSRRRAEAVSRYLIAGGVPAADLQVEGRGEADPVVTDCAQTGRKALIACLAPNRRVELSGDAIR